MTNSQITFTARNVFQDIVSTKIFNVQYETFFDFSNFIKAEHKQFNKECVENIDVETWTNYNVKDCSEDKVEIILK